MLHWLTSWSCDLTGLCRQGVPSEYTTPGSLYSRNDRVDKKKLRRLINEGKLVPMFPGQEEATPPPEHDLYAAILARLLKRKGQVDAATLKEHMLHLSQAYEACPICFLHYPALNTSRCCAKRICTECYLQVQTGRNAVPTCPFCKLPGYTAKFLGLKTGEEREQERLEEQKVIEARIREREEEVRRDQEREAQRMQEQQQREEQQRQRQEQAAAAAAAVAAAAAAAGHGSQPPAAVVASAVTGIRAANAMQAPPSPTTSSDTWQSASPRHGLTPTHAQQQQQDEAAGGISFQDGGRAARQPHGVQAQGAARGHSPARMRARPGARAGQGGAYRWADYVPAGAVDITMDVEDLNTLMLEQAMYDSIAASAGPASTAPGAPARAAGRAAGMAASMGATRPRSRSRSPAAHARSSTSSRRSSGAHTAGTAASHAHHASSPRARGATRALTPLPSPRARLTAAPLESLPGMSLHVPARLRHAAYRVATDSDSEEDEGVRVGRGAPRGAPAAVPSASRAAAAAAGSQQAAQRTRAGAQARVPSAGSTTSGPASTGALASPGVMLTGVMSPDMLTEEQQLELALKLSLAESTAAPTAAAAATAPAPVPAAPAAAAAAGDAPVGNAQASSAGEQQQQQQQHGACTFLDSDDEGGGLRSKRNLGQLGQPVLQLPLASPTAGGSSLAAVSPLLAADEAAPVSTISPSSPFLPVLPMAVMGGTPQPAHASPLAPSVPGLHTAAMQPGVDAEASASGGLLIGAVHAGPQHPLESAQQAGGPGSEVRAAGSSTKQPGPAGVPHGGGAPTGADGQAEVWQVGRALGEGSEHGCAWGTAAPWGCCLAGNKQQEQALEVQWGSSHPTYNASLPTSCSSALRFAPCLLADSSGGEAPAQACDSSRAEGRGAGGADKVVPLQAGQPATAAAVAAVLAQQHMHVGMVFVVWDSSALPTLPHTTQPMAANRSAPHLQNGDGLAPSSGAGCATGAAQACSARGAGNEDAPGGTLQQPALEALIADISAADGHMLAHKPMPGQPPVVMIQHPDGSSACAVGVSLGAAAATAKVQQAPVALPNDADLDTAAQQLLQLQDSELAALEQGIAAAAYGDYDVTLRDEPSSQAADLDAQLAASIHARDAQLLQAYRRLS